MVARKGFIDKENSVSYQLVHRSQKDPLQADENASKWVLKAMMPSSNLLRSGRYDLNQLPKEQYQELSKHEEIEATDFGCVLNDFSWASGWNPNQDAALHGIYFDDQNGYDYMQHLKPMGEDPSAVFIGPSTTEPKKKSADITWEDTPEPIRKKVTFELPFEALPSKTENPIGLLNLAAPGSGFDPSMDPALREVLEALEDEEYVEEDLEDGFFGALGSDHVPEAYQDLVQKAQEEQDAWHAEHDRYRTEYADSDDEFEVSSEERDRKSRYAPSNFSMTSSAMFRNDKLTLLDDQFDKVLEDYSDEDDEVDGTVDVNRVDALFDDFLEETEVIGRRQKVIPKRDALAVKEASAKTTIEELVQRMELEETRPQMEEVEERIRENWDVESVLSTYSNIYNRPALIQEASKGVTRIRLSGKNKMPVIQESEDESEASDTRAENKGEARPRSESKEDKKARKQAIKQDRKLKRATKKATKEAFKWETVRQIKLKESQVQELLL